MRPTELFLFTMADLRKRIEHPQDEYDLLMAAGLLRKLLLDEQPLVHQVNRELRVKLTFCVATNDAYEAVVFEDNPLIYVVNDGIYPPSALPSAVVKEMKLDVFLARRAAFVQGHDVTVKDLIFQLAHVEGAIHAGTPKGDKEKVLAGASDSIRIGGAGMVASTMRGIGRVVLEALSPIEAALRS